MNLWFLFAVSGGLAMVISWITTYVVTKYGQKLKIIDDPKTHKHPKVVHQNPVPRGGGIPIFFSLLIGVLFFAPENSRLWGIVLAAALLAVVGFLDDRFEEQVSPYLRLGVNVLAALIVIATGIGIAYITNPLGGIIDLSWPRWCWGNHCIWILSDLLALVWLVGMQNIVGWSSGVDGQMPGFVVIAATTMAALGLSFGQDNNILPMIILAGITAGAYLGFLPWNFYPQKIMTGYGGKSLAGFLLGTLAIMSSAKVGAMILVLGIPIIDGVLVIIKRLRERRNPMLGGYDHLHHYLLNRGWGKRRISIFYWGMSGLFAILALRLNSQSKYFTMAAVALVITGIILWLQYFSISQKRPDPDNGLRT